MARGLHPLLESGILLTAITAVLLNFYFNGGKADQAGAVEAAKAGQAH
jgi:NCS2 family nucleobase:cation symporter-2